MTAICAYHRVSTARQGASGLGLEAQEAAITAYASSINADIVASFTEVESGTKNNRPELQKALEYAHATGSILAIAKIDRLSRNAAFLLQLKESGVRFVAADMPSANELTVGIMALVAAEEARAISKRTRSALQAAKARGTRLGNPNGADALRRANKGNVASVKARKSTANAAASKLAKQLCIAEEKGHKSLQAIADHFNKIGVKTPRQQTIIKRHLDRGEEPPTDLPGQWYAASVRNLKQRLTPLGESPCR